jgi:hypothetical protein
MGEMAMRCGDSTASAVRGAHNMTNSGSRCLSGFAAHKELENPVADPVLLFYFGFYMLPRSRISLCAPVSTLQTSTQYVRQSSRQVSYETAWCSGRVSIYSAGLRPGRGEWIVDAEFIPGDLPGNRYHEQNVICRAIIAQFHHSR